MRPSELGGAGVVETAAAVRAGEVSAVAVTEAALARIAARDAAYRAQVAYLYERSTFYRAKLTAAGFPDPASVGGLADIAHLPFTEKDELRASRTPENAIGAHLAAPMADIVRIYSTSGTTGIPSYIPLTRNDLACGIEISCRSYGASGLRPLATTIRSSANMGVGAVIFELPPSRHSSLPVSGS